MRTREYGINVRVTKTEKNKLTTNAEKCRLSVSAYLRKLGLGQEIMPPPTEEFQALYKDIFLLQSRLPELDKPSIEACLEEILKKVLALYHGTERCNGAPEKSKDFLGKGGAAE